MCTGDMHSLKADTTCPWMWGNYEMLPRQSAVICIQALRKTGDAVEQYRCPPWEASNGTVEWLKDDSELENQKSFAQLNEWLNSGSTAFNLRPLFTY